MSPKKGLFREGKKMDTPKGAVIFVVSGTNRFFVIEERQEKAVTGKGEWVYSTFCETREDNEDYIANLFRGLQEETGIPLNSFDQVFDYSQIRIWETKFIDNVWATVMLIKCKNEKLFFKLFGTDHKPHEVEPVGWMTLKEFKELEPLRRGVANIISNFESDVLAKK